MRNTIFAQLLFAAALPAAVLTLDYETQLQSISPGTTGLTYIPTSGTFVLDAEDPGIIPLPFGTIGGSVITSGLDFLYVRLLIPDLSVNGTFGIYLDTFGGNARIFVQTATTQFSIDGKTLRIGGPNYGAPGQDTTIPPNQLPFALDMFTIRENIPVPEPSTVLLATLGLVALIRKYSTGRRLLNTAHHAAMVDPAETPVWSHRPAVLYKDRAAF